MAEAVTAIISQTAGAKLFDRALLTEHLEFCTQLAGHVSIRSLTYPRRLDCLPTVARAVEADLQRDD